MLTVVTLVDHRGRKTKIRYEQAEDCTAPQTSDTVGGFHRVQGMRGPYWMVVPKPLSRKRRAHILAQAAANDGVALIPPHLRHEAYPLSFDATGHPDRLDLPGLSRRWEKVVPVLDHLRQVITDRDRITLTVDEFVAISDRL